MRDFIYNITRKLPSRKLFAFVMTLLLVSGVLFSGKIENQETQIVALIVYAIITLVYIGSVAAQNIALEIISLMSKRENKNDRTTKTIPGFE